MAEVAGKIGMKILTIALGIPVGIATKKIVERVWAMARPDDPPRKPSERGAMWTDAMGWAALSAAGVVAAEFATRRGAEKTFRAITGNAPPPPKPGKAARKLEAAQAKVDARDAAAKS